jgi:alpha-amylase
VFILTSNIATRPDDGCRYAPVIEDNRFGSQTQTPVAPSFKLLAYALIFLRKEGTPCLFYGDLYGIRANVENPMTPACKGKLPILSRARKHFAYGEQQDYFEAANCIGTSTVLITYLPLNHYTGFVRYGNARHRAGLACLISNGGPVTKRMYVGPGHENEVWTDILRSQGPQVIVDRRGYGEFPVDAMSVSVWVNSAAVGRENLHENLYDSLCYFR